MDGYKIYFVTLYKMKDILDTYRKSIFDMVNVNVNKVVCEEHLYSILQDEMFDNNNHSRMIKNNCKPTLKKIEQYYWLYLPTTYEYDYKQTKKHYSELIDMYKPVWKEMELLHKSGAKFIVDCRSLKTRGEDLMTIFTPFISDDPVKIIKSKILKQDYIYMGNLPPFISIHKKVDHKEVFLKNANIIFLVDKAFSSIKDTYFNCLISNLSKRYKIYGNMGNYIGYIFNQYKLDDTIVRIPDTQVDIDPIDEIPDIYKPYLKF